MKEGIHEPTLCLTEEEAMGLLEIVMLAPGDLTSAQRAAVVKLSDFCRQFLREAGEPADAVIPILPSLHERAAFAA